MPHPRKNDSRLQHKAAWRCCFRKMGSEKSLVLCAVAILGACGRSDAEQAVVAKYPASSAVNFQSIVQRGNHVCGEANAPGSSGTNGYKRFFYSEDTRKADVEPHETYSEEQVVQFERTCQLLGRDGSGAGQTICSQAAASRGAFESRRQFANAWAVNCG